MNIPLSLGLPNESFPSIQGRNLIAGYNDLYTPRVGRQCLVLPFGSQYNPATVGCTWFAALKIDGEYHKLSSFNALAANDKRSMPLLPAGFILQAGEWLSINVDVPGALNISGSAIEFDEGETIIQTFKNLALSQGANTICRMPEGHSGNLSYAFGVNGICIVVNNSDVTVNHTFYQVQAGGVPDASNQSSKKTPVAAGMAFNEIMPTVLGEMEEYVVYSDSAVNQIAYLTTIVASW